MIGRECPNCPSILAPRGDGDHQCVTCLTVVRIETEPDTCPTCGQSTNPEPKHEARPPHPLTQIGKGAR